LPQPRAGATERIDNVDGKFPGLMTPTTPTGSRKTRFVFPGVSDGRIVPVICEGHGEAFLMSGLCVIPITVETWFTYWQSVH